MGTWPQADQGVGQGSWHCALLGTGSQPSGGCHCPRGHAGGQLKPRGVLPLGGSTQARWVAPNGPFTSMVPKEETVGVK